MTIRSLSHTSGDAGATPLLNETIGANLDRTVISFGSQEAIVDVPTGRRWTYTEFAAEVDALAAGLLGRGVKRGDRVGIWATNCPEWILFQYATARIGAILVTINPAYRPHELKYVLRQAEISLLASARTFNTSDYEQMVNSVRDECPSLTQVFYLGSPEWNGLLSAGREALQLDWELVAERQSELSPDDPINIQYTSGTTGFPKGATLSHRNILNNGYFVGELCGYSEVDRVCIPVPFYHCFGMVMGNLACTSHGATMVVPSLAFEPRAALQAVQNERCTSLYGVPTMFIAELDLPDFDSFDLSSLRTGIMAGSPCPVEVMKKVIDRMGMSEVSICYGMTETSPVSLQTRRADSVEQRTATVGRVGPHLEVKIIDPDSGEVVERGVPGEVCTRGYSVMLGYWRDEAKTAEAIDEDRWMHTGDIGSMDEQGYVSITGRIKDMVIRGGENIYPREVEEFLYTHPDIADAQVIGVPDEKYGEELMAWIRMREGATDLDTKSVGAYCSGKLAHYKIPRYVLVVDEFPMTVTGKVRKMDMRARAMEMLAEG